jgi:uncharacterized membrane protein YphA (DoxX/SURF4 family)
MDTNTIIWIVQIIVALVFFMAGMMKLTQSKEKAIEKTAWVEDFSPGALKAIGAVEVAGALGMIFPSLLNILPILTPLAGVGLVLTMIGAMLTHIRRQELPLIVPNIVLLGLAVFVAYGRFVLVPITG